MGSWEQRLLVEFLHLEVKWPKIQFEDLELKITQTLVLISENTQ